MTTEVRVKACCPDTIEVVVSVTGQSPQILQNGEYTTLYVHGARVVTVTEVTKPVKE